MEIWETHGETYSENDIPSGKDTKTYGKIHHFQWVNPLFLWSFSIAMLNYIKLPEGTFMLYYPHLCRCKKQGG